MSSQIITVGEFDTIRVPVPIDYVPAGTRVKDIKFKFENYPRHQLPGGAVEDVSALLEGQIVAAIPANLPLSERNISFARGVNPVTERIPQGMRAMTIQVDATSSVEGWAGSGAIVDVLLVEKNVTAVIAEKVRILSAERKVAPVEGEGAPNVPRTITILVTQEQCLAINTAVPRGRLSLALRALADDEDWQGKTYSTERLLAGSNGSEKKAKVEGVVSVNGKPAFALTDGKWVATEILPDGFSGGRK